MKINISKDELVSILGIALKGTSSRSTLPILSGMLIDASSNKVTFQTTDLEVSIRHTIACDVQEPGKTVVPAKLFNDIVKSLPDAAICVEASQDHATISCLESSFTLSTLNAVDFPRFPEVATSMSVTLPVPELASAVKRCGRTVSRDESRAILSGIYFALDGNTIHLASTDSYRLSCVDIHVENQEFEDFNAVIPGKIFEDITKLASSEDQVTIAFSENQVVFTFGATVFVSRKIEGTYPNYKQLIPKDKNTTVHVDTSALLTAVKRVSIMAQAHTPVKMEFNADEQKLTVSAKTQDVGGASENISVEMDGPSIDIAFNHQYLVDGLLSIDGDTVIEMQTSLKPGILKQEGSADFLYLAMPVRLS